MIYDHRTRKLTLHATDKRALSGAYGVLEGLAMIDSEPLPSMADKDGPMDVAAAAEYVKAVCERYGIALDEHLTKSQKSDVATGSVPGPPKSEKAPY